MSFRTTRTFIFARSLASNMAKALKTNPAAALLTDPTIELYKNDVLPTPDSVDGDFERCDFSGYSASAAALSNPANISSDIQGLVCPLTFTGSLTDPFVPNNIAGYILTDGAGEYYGGEQFEEVVPIAQAFDFLQLDVILPVKCTVDTEATA